jgi:hypothetical protein
MKDPLFNPLRKNDGHLYGNVSVLLITQSESSPDCQFEYHQDHVITA